MKKILFLLAAILLAAGLPLFAQGSSGGIVVTANAKNANPTLVFTGGLSNQELSAKILSDFQYCGWFTVQKSGNATYQVSAKGSLEDFTVTVSNSAGVAIHSFRITDSKDVDSAAHTAVDTVLNKLFGIPGICRSKIVFSAYTTAKNREIFICDFDGKNIKQLTNYNTLCIQPVWAFDGKSFLYIHYNTSHTNLMQYNMELGQSRRLAVDAGGSLSPDGKTLAMTNNVDLYTRPLEGGSRPKQITSGKAAETSPRWSPDGKKLCFVSDTKGGRPLLYVIDPFAGGKPTEIAGLVGSERVAPSWSTDNKLAYCAKIGRAYELRVAKLSTDGKSATMEEVGIPGKNTFPGEDPSWAPDNRHVTLTVNDAIYVIDTQLGATRKLVSGAREIGHSSWSPILK
jgi:TolB protein